MHNVYLRGDYLPLEQAKVPVEDRGFLFADGIYEVIRFYRGRPFQLQAHLKRLEHSARGVQLPLHSALADLPGIMGRLLVENNLQDTSFYVQYTRGTAHPRTHTFPRDPDPTLFVMPVAVRALPEDAWTSGVAAVTMPDLRWRRCDIKSTMLLPNVMAKQQARDQGAYEAILVRDGVVTEGSSTNIFALIEGALTTHPADEDILAGITRQVVLALASELGLRVREEAFTLDQLNRASEVFLTSTTSEVLPITQVDGRTMGDGRPGPVASRLFETFQRRAAG